MRKYLLIALLFVSCGNPYYVHKACKFHLNHTDITDSLSSVWYPITTKFIKGEPKYLPGIPTIEKGDSFPYEVKIPYPVTHDSFIYIKGKIPKIKQIDTFGRVDTFVRADSAFAMQWKGKYDKEVSEHNITKHTLTIWEWIGGISCGLIFLYLIWLLVIAFVKFK